MSKRVRDPHQMGSHPSEDPRKPKPSKAQIADILLELVKKQDFKNLNSYKEQASTARVFNQVPFIIYLLQIGELETFKQIDWDPDAFDEKYLGNNVLNIATELEMKKFIKEIILRNPNSISYVNDDGLNSFQIAVRNNNIELVTAFINHYANNSPREAVSLVNTEGGGLFPIHFAAFNKNMELIDLLLQNGANPYAKDEEGLMAIDYFDPEKDAQLIANMKQNMLLFRAGQCFGEKHNNFNTVPEPIRELIQKDPDFVEDCIGKYRIDDFHQLLCIHDNDLVNTILTPELIHTNVTYEEYQEFYNKYPIEGKNDIIEQNVESNETFIQGRQNLQQLKYQIDELQHQPEQVPKEVIQQLINRYKQGKGELKKLKEDLFQKEVERQHQEEEKRFNTNPPTWAEIYIERCPILYRLNKAGFKLLHFIARSNNAELFKYFVKNSNLLTIDNEGRNILHHIAECNSRSILEIIQNSFDDKAEHILKLLYDKEDKNGYTPYFTAIKFFNPEPQAFKTYKSSSNSKHQTELHIAILSKNSRFIAENIADNNRTFQSSIDEKDINGKTPLDLLCENTMGDPSFCLQTLFILLENCQIDFNSFLLRAVKSQNIDLIKLLIEEGADPTYSNSFQITPLHQAAYQKSQEIINILDPDGKYRAEFTNKDCNGKSIQDLLPPVEKPQGDQSKQTQTEKSQGVSKHANTEIPSQQQQKGSGKSGRTRKSQNK